MMKHKIGIILLVFVLAMTCVVNVNAQTVIKEDSTKYEGDVYIIGSSRFDSNVIVTGTMAGVAGARETVIQYSMYGNQEFDPESIKVYLYSGLDGTWSVLPRTTEDEFVTLEEDEAQELEENLNIYYVNEVEKTVEIPYDVKIKEGYKLDYYIETIGKQPKIRFENGKLLLPATVTYFETYLVNEQDTNDVIPLDTIEQTDSVFEIKNANVSTLEELKQAIADEKAEIRLMNDIVDITETITIPYQVYFNGAEHKLAFKNIVKTQDSELASGLVIAGDDSTVVDLTIEMDGKSGWQGNYALQVYGAAGVTIANYTGTKADAALLVNGSVVTLHDTINVTGNEFGGIEVSKGDDPSLEPSTLYSFATIVMDDEAIDKPVIWIENTEGFIGYTEQSLVENSNIPMAMGTNQTYYYSSENVFQTIEVDSAEELIQAIALEDIETIALAKDIDLPTAVEVNRTVTVNLNNHNLTMTEDTVGDGVFHVVQGGDLTINGDGIVNGVGNNDWNMAVFADGGFVTINGGTYTNVGATGYDPDHFDLIYAKGEGQIIINGGYFEGQTPAWLLNIKDANRDTAWISVYGGTFVGFNPAENKAEGDYTNFVAPECKVVENNGEFTVEKYSEEDVAISGWRAYSDLQTAVDEEADGALITLIQDIDLPTCVLVDKTISIDLNNHNLTVTQDTAGDGVFHVVTGGNLTIIGDGIVNGVGNNDWNMAIFADGGSVTINGGTYTNVGATGVDPDHFDLIYARGEGNVTINGGRFEGQTPAWLLNLKDKDRATAWIAVFGGTFVGLNPSESTAEGDETKFVADGFNVAENGNEYTVVPVEQID